MSAHLLAILPLVLLGFGVGFFQTALGFGGGTLIVPVLDLLVPSLTIQQVIATSLFIISVTALTNVISYHRMKLISWSVGLQIAAFALLSSLVASQIVPHLSPHWSRIILAVAYLWLILLSLLPSKKIPYVIRENNLRNKIVMGLGVGILSGFTGIGGGTIVVPILLAGRWMDAAKVPGTSNIVNCVATSVALIGFEYLQWNEGSIYFHPNHLVQWETGIIICIGAYMSGPLFRKWQKDLTERTKKKMIAAILSILFIKLIKDLL